MMIMVMNLNPVKDSSGCEEKKRDEEILVDADSRHLKTPDGDDADDDGDDDYFYYDSDDKILNSIT